MYVTLFLYEKPMIQRALPILLFAAVAIAVIQLINVSFSQTYRQIETSVQKPYQQAQVIFEREAR